MNGDVVTISYLRLMVSWPILNRLLSEKILPQGAYWLSRNVSNLFPYFQKMYKEQGELVRKYGTLNEEKQEWVADKDNPDLLREYDEFKTKEFSVTVNKIELRNFICPITAQEMEAIGYMVTEDKVLIDTPYLIQ